MYNGTRLDSAVSAVIWVAAILLTAFVCAALAHYLGGFGATIAFSLGALFGRWIKD